MFMWSDPYLRAVTILKPVSELLELGCKVAESAQAGKKMAQNKVQEGLCPVVVWQFCFA